MRPGSSLNSNEKKAADRGRIFFSPEGPAFRPVKKWRLAGAGAKRPPGVRRGGSSGKRGKVIAAAVPACLLIFAFLFFFFLWRPPGGSGGAGGSGEVRVVISENTTSREAGVLLAEKKLVRSPLLFWLYTRVRGVDGQLKAGEYSFAPPVSLPELVRQLTRGQPEMIKITVPEGYTLEEIADLLAGKGIVKKEAFLAEAETGDFPYPFLAGLPPGPKRLEGYLFPDTYYVNRKISAHEMIDLMIGRFAEELKALDYLRRAQEAGVTLHAAVTIASLVEREAKVDAERPLIAGVIFNRLHAGMPLQIDATVQYALGGPYRPNLTYKDLEVDSPYNTYRISGLPPTPIASPGRASLLAAVCPRKTDFYYYVARPDGTHAFARTLAEHEENKRLYQQ